MLVAKTGTEWIVSNDLYFYIRLSVNDLCR